MYQIFMKVSRVVFPTMIYLFSPITANTVTTSTANKDDIKPYYTTLDNGLKLWVYPDHRAPAAVVMVWYNVGSKDEPLGLTGISHMLEHMMFKGTSTRGPNEYSKLIANSGGQDNAFTSYDYTAYFAKVPSDQIDIVFELEADRMVNLKLTEEDFASERQVVAEERRLRIDNVPQSRFMEQTNTIVWATSPYRNPIIGWPQDIERWQLSDLQTWYERYYRPNNALVVVVGDVKAEQAEALAKKHFAPLEAKTVAKQSIAFEIESLGEKNITMSLAVQQPILLQEYQVPSLKTAQNIKDVQALSMLANILDGGLSARFEKQLVRQDKIAAQVSANYQSMAALDTTFSLYGVPQTPHDVMALRQAFMQQIEAIKTHGVNEEERQRALIRIKTSLLYQQDSLFTKAFDIGMSETIGVSYEKYQAFIAGLEKITSEDIQSVAKRYLVTKNLTNATLHPLEQANQSDKKIK